MFFTADDVKTCTRTHQLGRPDFRGSNAQARKTHLNLQEVHRINVVAVCGSSGREVAVAGIMVVLIRG